MSNEFVSRFSSQKPEDIAWRGNVAWVDAAIEGIERHPALAQLTEEMKFEDISIEEKIKRVIAFNLNITKDAAE